MPYMMFVGELLYLLSQGRTGGGGVSHVPKESLLELALPGWGRGDVGKVKLSFSHFYVLLG